MGVLIEIGFNVKEQGCQSALYLNTPIDLIKVSKGKRKKEKNLN